MTSTEPSAKQPDGAFPIGTRVQYNALTGTVTDPEHPLMGQRDKGHRLPCDGVWIYLDPRNHSRGVNGHGMWARLDDPALRKLAVAGDSMTGRLVMSAEGKVNRRATKRWTRVQCTWCTSRATHRLFNGAEGAAWGCDGHMHRWLAGEEM